MQLDKFYYHPNNDEDSEGFVFLPITILRAALILPTG